MKRCSLKFWRTVTSELCSVSLPPSGMASLALTTRFMMTCSSWLVSARVCPVWVESRVTNSMFSPIKGRNRRSMSAMTVLTSITLSSRSCLRHGLDLLVHGAALFQLLQQHLGVSVNDHQKVVEVVGDAAGEAADGIHFLRLAKLLFELTPVGDIFGDQFQYFLGFIADSGGAAAEPHDDDAPVFAFPLHFHPIPASGAAIVFGQPVQLLRIDEDFAPRIQPEKIFDRFMPEHGDERRIHVQESSSECAAANAEGRAQDQRTGTGLGAAERFFITLVLNGRFL